LITRVEAEKDVAVRTSILRASSVSPPPPGPSLLCLPAIKSSSPDGGRSSQLRSPSLSPVAGARASGLSVTDSGVQQRQSAFGSFVGFRASASSETLPDIAAMSAAQAAYTVKVRA
jgi:hypothetical protein